MILTPENYFSSNSSMQYLSASQYKDFVGTAGQRGCEAQAMAKIRGEWTQKMTTPLLVGSYVDSHFEGTLDIFKAKNPEVFTQKGELKSTFKQAEEIIARIERDPYFMLFMSGEKQVIMEAEMLGTKWKGKIDSLLNNKVFNLKDENGDDYQITVNAIVDLKVMKSLRTSHYVKDSGYMTFVEYWGYDIQGSIYQMLVEYNLKKIMPFYIAGASKEEVTDIEIIGFDQRDLMTVRHEIEKNVDRILQVKSGKVEPDRCECCEYCTFTKVLSKPIHFTSLIKNI